MKTWTVLFCLILPGAAFRAPAPIAPRARVDGGVVEGSYFDARTSDAVFKGIPFAAPPVGDLRWKPPAPVRPWSGFRSAKEFAPICPQRLYSTEFYAGLATRLGGHPPPQRPLTTSEDCLDWPRYEPTSDRYLELGDSVRVGSRLRQKQYDLLDDAQAALDGLFRR